ncbi:hypothetical protein V2A60_008186 [Cordyceps javanica]|uniref:Multidrug and toxin extrusion protein n=1 Tax=Cordyceps javanica TaxID=43265 RepID=A0A545UNG6_9HYPO|nr:multidrug and toxin extrusion protein [Cordyceps javanica]TQW02749.1 multidrug and toxin extrusion protein [Cordyceps javanica]
MDHGAQHRDAAVARRDDTETTPLLKSRAYSVCAVSSAVTRQAPDARPKQLGPSCDDCSTWCQEGIMLATCATPLTLTCILQYSIEMSSLVAAARLGKIELGAASLANMSALITCYAIFQGLAASVDAMCSQAYRSGETQLVGLYCQRMMLLLLGLTVPMAISWLLSDKVMFHLLPNAESARLCSLHLKISILAIPGYAAFEVGKCFLKAKGLFTATTYALLVGAPANAVLMWLLIWKFHLGFIGIPVSAAITRTLLPIFLYLHVRLVDGSQCWGGFGKGAFVNLRTMIRLAVPRIAMIEAEWLAFAIMTIISIQFGVEYLAAQSILTAMMTLSYQVPFPLSIAASSRVAFLIGSGRVKSAKVAAGVAVAVSTTWTFLNFIIYIMLRGRLSGIFLDDEEVASLVASAMPIIAVSTFFDGVAVAAHALLRGVGKRSSGGKANLIAYYTLSIPLSIGFGVGLEMRIKGLWIGCILGLLIVSITEYVYVFNGDWHQAVTDTEAIAPNY